MLPVGDVLVLPDEGSALVIPGGTLNMLPRGGVLVLLPDGGSALELPKMAKKWGKDLNLGTLTAHILFFTN